MILGLPPNRTYTPVLFIGLLLVYGYLSFLGSRENHALLIGIYFSSFLLTYFYQRNEITLSYILISGLIFRLLFLFDLPALSQDYFRFLWDGLLLQEGQNPYRFTPNEWWSNEAFRSPLKSELYAGMGELSAQHYSNYPPINQLGFYISTFFSPNSIIASVVSMRLLLIFADIGVYFLSLKLLPLLKLDKSAVSYYFLNPLVIVELTGNLHWEGVMVFFFALGIYGLLLGKWQRAVFPMVLSIGTKLLPLITLPLLYQQLKLKKSLGFGGLCALGIFALFFPFFYGLGYENYLNTLRLWFTTFEFNASFYYIVRAIGFQIKGYNIIRSLGEITPFVIVLVILGFTFYGKKERPKKWISGILFLLSVYFLLSTTVHPWYICTLVFLGMLSHYSFPWIWSALVVLSYSAYGDPNFQENYPLLAMEYLGVIGVLWLEWKKKKRLFKHLK